MTLPEWIGLRSQRHPDRPAVTYIDDSGSRETWTYRQLWLFASELARRMPASQSAELSNGAKKLAPRAALLFPQGLEFLAGFLGCQLAGWTPVPTCFPKPNREMPRLNSVMIDCSPDAIVTTAEVHTTLAVDKLPELSHQVAIIDTDRPGDEVAGDGLDPESLPISLDDLAFLQYTSGSTSEPKGVMVHQSNVMANLEAIRDGFQIQWQDDDATDVATGVFWLPYYHDMGLIGGILEALYIGGHTVLLSPRAFLQRPLRWLQAISEFGASISGAPNFAYQLCVDRIPPDQSDGVDLSRWKLAFSGAEPVLPRTLKDFAHRFESCGFSKNAFYPCYGLAESTLLAAGGDGPSAPTVLSVSRASVEQGKPTIVDPNTADRASKRSQQKIVSCGTPRLNTEIILVDPSTRQQVDEGTIGEVWMRGPSVTSGYWGREQATDEQFKAALADDPDGNQYLRSGDLGFQHDGELYLTGRHKDVIIIRGRNLFPQDIEVTVSEVVGSDFGNSAALAVRSTGNDDLAIVAELPRHCDESEYPRIVRDIRRAVIEVHEVDPQHIWLVRPATIPLTTSGKVQRSLCRERFEAGEIATRHRYDRSSISEQVPIAFPEIAQPISENQREGITLLVEDWMTQWLVSRAGVDPNDIAPERSFEQYGLDSMTAVELSGETQDWSGVELTPVVAWTHPTITGLSAYIVNEMINAPLPTASPSPENAG
ncbi:AMP-binding protein [Stieleria varia]|nr:AMP-binding protein [Stieleria varia]